MSLIGGRLYRRRSPRGGLLTGGILPRLPRGTRHRFKRAHVALRDDPMVSDDDYYYGTRRLKHQYGNVPVAYKNPVARERYLAAVADRQIRKPSKYNVALRKEWNHLSQAQKQDFGSIAFLASALRGQWNPALGIFSGVPQRGDIRHHPPKFGYIRRPAHQRSRKGVHRRAPSSLQMEKIEENPEFLELLDEKV